MKHPKPKTITLSKAKEKARVAFSIYIRTRDALQTTGFKDELICFTCLKTYPAFGKGCAQAGHFIPGRHTSVFFDERNCHGQCYNCNINLKGNFLAYQDRMIEEYGQEVIDELRELDREVVHYKVADYEALEKFFKQQTLALG